MIASLLLAFVWRSRSAAPWWVPLPLKRRGLELVLRHKPSLLICTSDLETGYGMNLLRRVKAELPT